MHGCGDSGCAVRIGVQGGGLYGRKPRTSHVDTYKKALRIEYLTVSARALCHNQAYSSILIPVCCCTRTHSTRRSSCLLVKRTNYKRHFQYC